MAMDGLEGESDEVEHRRCSSFELITPIGCFQKKYCSQKVGSSMFGPLGHSFLARLLGDMMNRYVKVKPLYRSL